MIQLYIHIYIIQLYIHIYSFLDSFSLLSRVPCAIQQGLVGIFF